MGGLVAPALAPSSFLAISTATLVGPLLGQQTPGAPTVRVPKVGPLALLPLLMSPSDPEVSRFARSAAHEDLARAEQLDYLPERQARIDRMISRHPEGLLEKTLGKPTETYSPKPPKHVLPGSAEAKSYQDAREAEIAMSGALGNVARGRITDYHTKTGVWPEPKVAVAILAQLHEDYKAAGLSSADFAKANQGLAQWARDKAVGSMATGKGKVAYEVLREFDKLGDSHTAMGEKERQSYAKARLLREIEIANDPAIQSETNRHFQHFLLTAPQSARAAINGLMLVERYSNGAAPAIQFAPDPEAFRKAFDDQLKAKGEGGLVNPAIVGNKNLLESTKVKSAELLNEAKDRQIQTEKATGEAIKAEVSLGESEAALKKKLEEIKSRGGDPDEIFGSKEFEDYQKASEEHRLKVEEFNACCDEMGNLLGRLDPKLGRVFSASVNLARGLGKLSVGLSKIKFSDMLSVTSLAFALFDAFAGGPDPTQQKLDKIIDMINGLQKTVDELTDQVEKNHREVMARFDDIERGQVSARWEANLFYALLEEQIRAGFQQMIDLQVETLRSLGFVHEKLDEILANGQLSTVLLVKLQGGLLDLGDTVRSVDQDKLAADLVAWLENGNHPNGLQGVIEDSRNLYKGLFSTVQLLADNALRKVEGFDVMGLQKRAEIDLFDYAMTRVVRRPAALYRAVLGDPRANVTSLYDYEKLEFYLGLVYRVSNNLGTVKLSKEEAAKVELTREQLTSTRQLLKVARNVLDARMFEIQGKVFENIEGALAKQDGITRGLADKPIPMGAAGLSFLPGAPSVSLQGLADAEPPAVVSVNAPQILAAPARIDGSSNLSFKTSLEKAQWLQAEVVNEDNYQSVLRGAFASLGNTGDAYLNRITLEQALKKSTERMQDILLYANVDLPGKPASLSPRDGLMPYRRHGVWSDCKVSGAHAEAEYSWKAQIPFNFEYRSSPVEFDLGQSYSHPELHKQRLTGRPMVLGRLSVGFDLLNEKTGFAEYETIRTPRSFTQSNPGLPGEKIILIANQTSSAELRPQLTLPVYCGDTEIGHVRGTFGVSLPQSCVSVKSEAEFELGLDYNPVTRQTHLALTKMKYLISTNHHLEPAPTNQLLKEQAPKAQVRGGAGVPAVAFGKEVDVTPYLGDLAALNTAAGKSLSDYFIAEQKGGRINGEWRDGVLGWRASAAECGKSGQAVGLFQEGNQKYLRIAVTHTTENGGKEYFINIPVVGEMPRLDSQPSISCTTTINLSDIRKQKGTQEGDSPLAKSSAAFIKAELSKRTAEVVQNLTKSGTALQQAKISSVTSILILRRIFADFGHEYFLHDLELTAIRTGSISGALTNSWAGAGQANRLLSFAAKMAAIESGQIQGEQLIAIVSEARAELSEIRAQIDAARARGARYGTSILDSLEVMFSPVQ
jgi:hypothetical protein